MESIFLPISPNQAEEVINTLVEELSGFELVPIPALGGCVIAIKELADEGSHMLRWLQRGSHRADPLRLLSDLASRLSPDEATP